VSVCVCMCMCFCVYVWVHCMYGCTDEALIRFIGHDDGEDDRYVCVCVCVCVWIYVRL
jgi:hypothetical protein